MMTWLLDLAGIVFLIIGIGCAMIYRPATFYMPSEGKMFLRIGLGLASVGIAVILIG